MLVRFLKKKTKRLSLLQLTDVPNDWQEIKRLQGKIDHLLEAGDLWWKQHAKRNWFRGGDRNTNYFHAWTNHRRKLNHIGRIVDEHWTLWSKPEDVNRVFVQYYSICFLLMC